MKHRKSTIDRAGVLCSTLLLFNASLSFAGGVGHTHEGDDSQRTTKVAPIVKNDVSWPYQTRTLQAAANSTGQPAIFGQWSDLMSWPIIAVHANLLPNGKVLAWDATPDDFDDDPHTTENYTTRVTLWDPIPNTHVSTNNNTNADLFCAGSAHMWDGQILFAGGDSGVDGLNGPLPNTNIYDYKTNSWYQAADMATPRWYSSVAALANGEMLTYGGTYEPSPIAEVFTFDQTWRPLDVTPPPYASVDHQWLQTIPEGGVMSFGPQNTLVTIDTEGTGTLTPGFNRDDFIQRHYGSYAMYDIGKVLVAGGSDNVTQKPSYNSAVVIDTATQQTTDTGSLTIGRNQFDLTILADGTVMATGGNFEGATLVSQNGGVYTPEIWDPRTGQWSTMNDTLVSRQYHSIALLLPDGRVLSAGGGYCGTCSEIGYEEQNAQIFSPPYLFSAGSTLAVRPEINSQLSFIDYNTQYEVEVSPGANIAKAHLIKLGAVTHSQDQDQRLVPLEFVTSGNNVSFTAPEHRNIAPPGHYMLFLVDDEGVPSIGKIITVGQPLIESGSLVSNSVRTGEQETYLIESSEKHATLLVELDGIAPGTKLSVTGKAVDGSASATCETTAMLNSVECRLSNQAATSWELTIHGLTTTPYKMLATLSEVEDPNALLPPATPRESEPDPDESDDATDNTGGGAMPLIFLLLLLTLKCRLHAAAGVCWRAVR